MLAYLVCLVLAVRMWRRLEGQRDRAFWGMVAILMLALAINKQLDLQSAMTAVGRCLAQAGGWYDNRRIVQFGFILGLLALMIGGLLVAFRALHGQLRLNGVALVGLVILCGYVAIRAVGFHHMDALIGQRQFGVSANYVFENAGLLLIGLNAAARLRRGEGRTASGQGD